MLALLGTVEIAKVSPFSIFDSIHFLSRACAILHFSGGFGLRFIQSERATSEAE